MKINTLIQALCRMIQFTLEVVIPSHRWDSQRREGADETLGLICGLENLRFASRFDFQCGRVEQEELNSFSSGHVHGRDYFVARRISCRVVYWSVLKIRVRGPDFFLLLSLYTR